MKICIITEYFTKKDGSATGGVEARAFNIGSRLGKNHAVFIITSWQKGQQRKEEFANMTVYRVGKHHPYSNTGGTLSRLRFAFAAKKAAIKLGGKHNIEIIDGYNFISYIPAQRAARKLHIQCVATYHEVWIGEWVKNKGLIAGSLGSLWERINLRLKWDKIVAVSNFTKKRLEKHGKQAVVIPNGVDVAAFQHTHKKTKQPSIAYAGRLTKHKRVADLLKALAIIKNNPELQNVHCHIVGTGPEKERLEMRVKELQLQKHVTFHGFVKNYEDVKKIMQQSHVFCLPSVLEGFGMVVIEAMAAGTPYVCSDIDVLSEVTHNGTGGLLFKQEKHEDLAEKLKMLLTNKNLHQEKVKQAKEFVQRYDWDRIVEQTKNMYAAVINREEFP